MKKNFMRRVATIVAASAITVGAACMFAGCTSDQPEVTITYSFNGADYAVTYTLSRRDAPETVQHFIEIADSGFYDGTVVHSFDDNYLYGGGYTIEEGRLVEKDYFGFVKEYEKEHEPFTQTVYKNDEARTPLYTVVGEFNNNNRGPNGGKNIRHSRGALVMYYPTIDNFRYDVVVERADGGSNNEGDGIDVKSYGYNSATCQFYTFCGDSNTDRDAIYSVFGKAKDYTNEMIPLLNAITEYTDTLPEDDSFTTAYTDEDFPKPLYLFENVQPDDDDFAALRRSGITADDFKTPLKKPITIKSVKVIKY